MSLFELSNCFSNISSELRRIGRTKIKETKNNSISIEIKPYAEKQSLIESIKSEMGESRFDNEIEAGPHEESKNKIINKFLIKIKLKKLTDVIVYDQGLIVNFQTDNKKEIKKIMTEQLGNLNLSLMIFGERNSGKTFVLNGISGLNITEASNTDELCATVTKIGKRVVLLMESHTTIHSPYYLSISDSVIENQQRVMNTLTALGTDMHVYIYRNRISEFFQILRNLNAYYDKLQKNHIPQRILIIHILSEVFFKKQLANHYKKIISVHESDFEIYSPLGNDVKEIRYHRIFSNLILINNDQEYGKIYNKLVFNHINHLIIPNLDVDLNLKYNFQSNFTKALRNNFETISEVENCYKKREKEKIIFNGDNLIIRRYQYNYSILYSVGSEKFIHINRFTPKVKIEKSKEKYILRFLNSRYVEELLPLKTRGNQCEIALNTKIPILENEDVIDFKLYFSAKNSTYLLIMRFYLHPGKKMKTASSNLIKKF